MRDPKRIDRILNLLRAYWTQNPDLRLAQIVGNEVPGSRAGDIYNFEDDKLEAALRKRLDALTLFAADVRSDEVEKL